jgi:hypothetical protein
MLENQTYPEYIGISDVTTVACEQMRVEVFFEGQPSLMFDEPEGTDIGDPPDLRGFFFDLHLQPKYEQLNFDLIVETRERTERVRALATETHRRCPQPGWFRLAKIPMVVGWYRKGASKPVFEDRLALPRGRAPEEKSVAIGQRAARKRKQ